MTSIAQEASGGLEYAKLARYIAMLFYSKRSHGLHCVLLNALTKHEWIKEDILAKLLGLSLSQVRRALRELEQEFMISRVIMKDSKAPSQHRKHDAHSYCCIDYKRMVDICRLKVYKIRKKLKEALEETAKIENYECPDEECKRKYTSLEVLNLEVDTDTFLFLCEDCDTPLEKGGGALQSAEEKKKHQANMKKQLSLFESQLKPLMAHLKSLQVHNPPYFGTLQEWALVQERIRRANEEGISLGEEETDFVIEFEDANDAKDEDNKKIESKELPPWMRIGYQEDSERNENVGTKEEESNQDTVTHDEGGSLQRVTEKRKVESDTDNSNVKRIKIDQVDGSISGGAQVIDNEQDMEDDVEWEDI